MIAAKRVTALGVLSALVVVHVVWGLARVPGKVIARRIDDVAAYRSRGDAAFLLGNARLKGADAIEWVAANTALDAVVLWEGEPRGALEFPPALLAPRLLVEVRACPPGAVQYAGRTVARGTANDRTGAVVLIAADDGLRVEVR